MCVWCTVVGSPVVEDIFLVFALLDLFKVVRVCVCVCMCVCVCVCVCVWSVCWEGG